MQSIFYIIMSLLPAGCIKEYEPEGIYTNYGFMDGGLMFFSHSTSENPYYCWGRDRSGMMLLGTSEMLSGNLTHRKRLKEIPCSSDRLSIFIMSG